jgi:hypothetical protein
MNLLFYAATKKVPTDGLSKKIQQATLFYEYKQKIAYSYKVHTAS